jgi:hypothetical protein
MSAFEADRFNRSRTSPKFSRWPFAFGRVIREAPKSLVTSGQSAKG